MREIQRCGGKTIISIQKNVGLIPKKGLLRKEMEGVLRDRGKKAREGRKGTENLLGKKRWSANTP